MLKATHAVQKTTPRDARVPIIQDNTLFNFMVFTMTMSASRGGLPPADTMAQVNVVDRHGI